MKLCRFVTVVVSGLSLGMTMVSPAFAAGELRGQQVYEKSVLPVLQTFCYDCHADGVDKGGFLLDEHKSYAESMGDKQFWEHVREIMSTHVMPPENKDQPTLEERNLVLKWIEDEVFWVDPNKPDPGHVTLRRLNRTEYNNTVRDVLMVNTRPARKFPPDDTGYGYDNIGSVLTLSPMLMEKYLRAARETAAEAVWFRPAKRYEDELSGDEFKVEGKSGSERGGILRLTGNGEAVAVTDIKESGPYRVTLLLSSDKAGDENAKYAVLVDGKEVLTGEVEKEFDGKNIDGSLQRVAFDVPMEKGKRKVAVRFLNDYYDEKAEDAKRRDRNLLLSSAHVVGPIKMMAVAQSPFLEWLLQGKKISPAQLVIQGDDFDKIDGGGVILGNQRAVFASNGSVRREFELPADGEYRVMLVASANQAGDERARISVKVDDEVRTMEITEPDGKNQTLTFTTKKFKAGKNSLIVGFVNDYYQNGKDRNAYLESVQIVGPMGSETAKVFDPEFARQWITRMGLKMFRRPVEAGDLEKLMGLVSLARQDGASRQEVITVVLEAMLGSSKFLFNGAPKPAGNVENGSALVDEFTLASRLSYFIWSSAPDDRLLDLAGKGQLRANLQAEVKRMIGDWKGRALTDNFAGQWLRLRDIELMSPHQRLFPEFYEGSLRNDMKRESEMFFDHILRDNRSALEILDSDYTFMNETLAKFYGVEGVKGSKFQKVSLKGTPRGGLLTQAGILALTSHPTRTSPVKRGQFLLENVLGTPPPPAPQNVPAFGEDRGAKVEGTLRQRFEAHRANPSCSSCHAFLDPFGFAFENYDAIGRWRDKDNKEAVDASGKLLTGEVFNGAQELRKLLVDLKRDDYTRNLIENLLIYSLGRGLEFSDKLFIRQLKQQAQEKEYRMQDIIVSVIDSVPFQRMRVEETKQGATTRVPEKPAAPKLETAKN
jgi:hypothetical protein